MAPMYDGWKLFLVVGVLATSEGFSSTASSSLSRNISPFLNHPYTATSSQLRSSWKESLEGGSPVGYQSNVARSQYYPPRRQRIADSFDERRQHVGKDDPASRMTSFPPNEQWGRDPMMEPRYPGGDAGRGGPNSYANTLGGPHQSRYPAGMPPQGGVGYGGDEERRLQSEWERLQRAKQDLFEMERDLEMRSRRGGGRSVELPYRGGDPNDPYYSPRQPRPSELGVGGARRYKMPNYGGGILDGASRNVGQPQQWQRWQPEQQQQHEQPGKYQQKWQPNQQSVPHQQARQQSVPHQQARQPSAYQQQGGQQPAYQQQGGQQRWNPRQQQGVGRQQQRWNPQQQQRQQQQESFYYNDQQRQSLKNEMSDEEYARAYGASRMQQQHQPAAYSRSSRNEEPLVKVSGSNSDSSGDIMFEPVMSDDEYQKVFGTTRKPMNSQAAGSFY